MDLPRDLYQLTVPLLRAELSKRSLPTTGDKRTLVFRLRQYLNTERGHTRTNPFENLLDDEVMDRLDEIRAQRPTQLTPEKSQEIYDLFERLGNANARFYLHDLVKDENPALAERIIRGLTGHTIAGLFISDVLGIRSPITIIRHPPPTTTATDRAQHDAVTGELNEIVVHVPAQPVEVIFTNVTQRFDKLGLDAGKEYLVRLLGVATPTVHDMITKAMSTSELAYIFTRFALGLSPNPIPLTTTARPPTIPLTPQIQKDRQIARDTLLSLVGIRLVASEEQVINTVTQQFEKLGLVQGREFLHALLKDRNEELHDAIRNAQTVSELADIFAYHALDIRRGRLANFVLKEIKTIIERNPLRELSPPIFRKPVGFVEISVSGVANGVRNQWYFDDDMNPYYLRSTSPMTYAAMKGEKFTDDVLAKLGYANFGGTFDDKLAFLRLLENYPYPDLVNEEQKKLLLGMPTEELLELLDDYPYPKDRASVLWAILKRYEPPFYSDDEIPIIQEISEYPMFTQAHLAQLYQYDGDREGKNPSVYSYARHVALQNPRSVMDPFIILYEEANLNDLARQAGMKIPPTADPKKYYFGNLREYEPIFRRPEDAFPPIEYIPSNPATLKKELAQFTDYELEDTYELSSMSNANRDARLSVLARNIIALSKAPEWTFRSRRCANTNRFNILTGDPRNNDDEDDPILSYGTLFDYTCYNLEELEASFRITPTGFEFGNPDWIPGEPNRNFPIESMKQLKELLESEKDPKYGRLLDLVKEGLREWGALGVRVQRLKSDYEAMDSQAKDVIRDYLAWILLTAMVFRFWNGPPNAYPVVWREGGGARDPNLCTRAERDENSTRWMALRTSILSKASPELEKWLLDLPRIRYNFRDGDTGLGAETLDSVYQLIQQGEYCLADGSDRFLQTGYYLITRILGLHNVNEMNSFLRNELVRLYREYELPGQSLIIRNQLNSLAKPVVLANELNAIITAVNRTIMRPLGEPAISENATKEDVIRTLQNIQNNLPLLQQKAVAAYEANVAQVPNFVPGGVETSHHTDPDFGQTLREIQ